MKEQLIEKVRVFREAFRLKQDSLKLHHDLFIEEFRELFDAPDMKEYVDALADMVFVSAGGVIDGFSQFSDDLDYTITLSLRANVDLPRAVDAVFASNMSKLCSKNQINDTAGKYAAIGVPVYFEPVDPLNESAGFRCMCENTVNGTDGKEYPAGKLLKSVGYEEPDWSYLNE